MKYLIPIFVIIFLIMPFIAEGAIPLTYEQKLEALLGKIQSLLFMIALGIGLIVIVISGITYMTSAGEQEKITKAKKILTYGIVGVAIVLAAAFIMGAIDAILYQSGI